MNFLYYFFFWFLLGCRFGIGNILTEELKNKNKKRRSQLEESVYLKISMGGEAKRDDDSFIVFLFRFLFISHLAVQHFATRGKYAFLFYHGATRNGCSVYTRSFREYQRDLTLQLLRRIYFHC